MVEFTLIETDEPLSVGSIVYTEPFGLGTLQMIYGELCYVTIPHIDKGSLTARAATFPELKSLKLKPKYYES